MTVVQFTLWANFILAPLLLILQLFDVYGTYKIVRSGGDDFSIPGIKWFYNTVGLIPGLIITKTIVVILTTLFMCLYADTIEVTIGLIIANLFYLFICTKHRLHVLRKLEQNYTKGDLIDD